jgi:hypothetical protein
MSLDMLQSSSQLLKHLFFTSHQVYPADPMQPWLSLSPPTMGEFCVVGDLNHDQMFQFQENGLYQEAKVI